jgi:putative Mg2+ transporter-C (MgtC) family protein
MWPYFLNLYDVLRPAFAGAICVVCSMLCGLIVGLERRARNKPAGLRTMMLIAAGSTIFTMSSVLIADSEFADPGRIAAQVVTGIGFLGAGAIIRHRGEVHGLTTGATIWAVAAIGVMIGTGYAAAGVGLVLLVVGVLLVFREHEGEETH